MPVSAVRIQDQVTEERIDSDSRPRSLAGIFEEMEGPLLAFANNLMKDKEEAQDIVQEGFLRLHRHFDEVRNPVPWLYRTVRNLAYSHVRKYGRTVAFSPLDSDSEDDGPSLDVQDDEPLPDARIERMESVGLAMICLERLTDDAKELINMKFVEELSYKEMSSRTGMTVSNVGYKLHHAIKFLATEMNKEGAFA